MTDELLQPGRSAVITGAASGIGLAAAKRFASLGLNVCLADLGGRNLDDAVAQTARWSRFDARVIALPTDVADIDALRRLHDGVRAAFGDINLLMNNAAVNDKGGPWTDVAAWRRTLGVNLWGVINGLQTFVPGMIAQKTRAAIVNTGSKQGITTPPGNAAYNVSKAGVKVVTEQLAHELRQAGATRVSAHLLIPGFTFTRMTLPTMTSQSPLPPGAWLADQVVDLLVQGLESDQFYILCPDDQTTPEMDRRRMQWAADDVIKGRPALSRWHADHAADFRRHMDAKDEG
jgi:NAD(P)-dependent dehydrogenase (short-subunit alcohol dehydrogenase family)